jgi:sulfur transfer protein SufE
MVLGMKKKRKKYLLFKGEDDAKVIQGTLYIILQWEI